jgi:hypothetical protein
MVEDDNRPLLDPHFDERGPGLSPETIEEFLIWVGGAPGSAMDVIRNAIDSADRSHDMLAGLVDNLLRLPVADISRHFVLLHVIGEVRDRRLAEALERFVWLSDDEVYRPSGPIGPCDFPDGGVLQSAAAEMLAWTLDQEDEGRVLEIAQDHPDVSVRAAAISAYLFNRGDSEAARTELRTLLRPEDRVRVDVARYAVERDEETFNDAVAAFLEAHPDEYPRESTRRPPKQSS